MASANDAIGRSVTFPLPEFQTVAGGRDPLPSTSPIAIRKVNDQEAVNTLQIQRQNNLAHVRRIETDGLFFDPVTQLRAKSVYSIP